MGIVYVLVNPAFEGYVKIGRTDKDLKKRLKELDTTSVPLPFRCVFAIKVDDSAEVERLIHQAFADVRVRPRREFFEINPQRVIAALRLTSAEEVTPKSDIAADKEGIEALERKVRKRRSSTFADAHVQVGDELIYTKNEEIKAKVISNKEIDFKGTPMSLRRATLEQLHADGYKWKEVNGWEYWMKDNETLYDRVRRYSDEEEDEGSV